MEHANEDRGHVERAERDGHRERLVEKTEIDGMCGVFSAWLRPW